MCITLWHNGEIIFSKRRLVPEGGLLGGQNGQHHQKSVSEALKKGGANGATQSHSFSLFPSEVVSVGHFSRPLTPSSSDVYGVGLLASRKTKKLKRYQIVLQKKKTAATVRQGDTATAEEAWETEMIWEDQLRLFYIIWKNDAFTRLNFQGNCTVL